MSDLLRVWWNQWDLRLSPLLELIERDNNSEWKGRDRSYLYFHQLPDGLDIFLSSFSAWHVLMLRIKPFACTHDLISGLILQAKNVRTECFKIFLGIKRFCLLSKQRNLSIVYSKLCGLLHSCTYLCQATLLRFTTLWKLPSHTITRLESRLCPLTCRERGARSICAWEAPSPPLTKIRNSAPICLVPNPILSFAGTIYHSCFY